MLRVGRALVALLLLLAAPPVYAAGDSVASGPGDLRSVTAQEDAVRGQLADTSEQITDLNLQIAALQRSIAGLEVRIAQKKAQVRMLARFIYTQPDSALGYLAESSTLGDALTRLADLTAAGERATSVRKSLARDLAAQRAEQDRLQQDRGRLEALRARLETQFAQLERQAATLRTPPPAPPAPAAVTRVDPVQAGSIQDIILRAFAPLGPGAQAWALRIAKCESGYNPYAVNRASGASGLFQFLPSTWAFTPQHAASPFDPVANSEAAAWLYNRSGPTQWQCR